MSSRIRAQPHPAGTTSRLRRDLGRQHERRLRQPAAARAHRSREALHRRRRSRHRTHLRNAPHARLLRQGHLARRPGRPVEKIDGPVLDALRLGAHQLLSMRTADHAAVNESVELAREYGSRSASGFANGVLRTISRSTLEEWREAVVGEESDPDEKLALLYSHPAWIVRALRQGLDAEGRADELEALLAADNAAPRVNLVAPAGPGRLRDRRVARRAEPLLAGRSRPRRRRPDGHHEALARHRARAGRGLPARRARPQPRASDRGRGALARPLRRSGRQGGAARGRGAGGRSRTARERAGPGARRARALGARPRCPATSRWPSSTAPRWGSGIRQPSTASCSTRPCTGLGALRRRPEARWRKSPRDVAELSALQAQAVRRRRRRAEARRRPRLRHLLAAHRRDPRRRPRRSVTLERRARAPRHQRRARRRRGRAPARPRRRPAHRAALAAPPRHRRHVHRAVPAHIRCAEARPALAGPLRADGRLDPMPARINPSILSADFANLESELGRIRERRRRARRRHGQPLRAEPHLRPARWSRACSRSLRCPLDVHLMIDDPDRWAPGYAEAGAFSVTFHAEAAREPVALARALRERGARAGLAAQARHPGRALPRDARTSSTRSWS